MKKMIKLIQKRLTSPVMLGDIDQLIEKGPNYFDTWIEVLDLWIEKSKPMEKQSIECIAYVYNLINEEKGRLK